MNCFPTPTPPIRSGAWPPRWCWPSCAPRWRCPITPQSPLAGPALHHRPLRRRGQAILEHLSAELPEVTDWAGTVGVGIAANNVEYFDEPAMAVMLCDLAPRSVPRVQWRGAAGGERAQRRSDGFVAHTALVHADGGTPDLPELITEVAERTTSGYVFGGLASSRTVRCAVRDRQRRARCGGQGAASGVFQRRVERCGVWRPTWAWCRA